MLESKTSPKNIDTKPQSLDILGNESLDRYHIAGGEHISNKAIIFHPDYLVVILML